jgi:flavin reductase (DIM6/NTAB) family NADH-FMN oxidoreductase RutF
MPAIEWSARPAAVRAVLSHRAAGVAVLTTCLDDERRGLTVTAWCSVSLDPPLVLACIERVTTSHDLIERAGHFGLTLLAREQELLADRFAGRALPVGPDFHGVPTVTAVTGVPLLAGGLGWLDCRVVGQLAGGDHTIFLGEVVAAATAEDADQRAPLLSLRRRYTRPEA